MYDEAAGVALETSSSEASIAALTLEKYVNGAIIQWNRIEEIKQTIVREILHKPDPRIDRLLMQRLYLEVYFYFLCYDKARNHMRHFIKADGDPELENLWESLKFTFRLSSDSLSRLEFIEDRLPSEHLFDIGTLENDTFTLAGKHFDISAKGLRLLTNAYEKAIETLRSRQKQRI